MASRKQKFHKGDLVKIAKDLGPYMAHFDNDCYAIVLGSYADEFGGDNIESYTLHLKGRGEQAWYEEDQLMLIESGRLDVVKKWEGNLLLKSIRAACREIERGLDDYDSVQEIFNEAFEMWEAGYVMDSDFTVRETAETSTKAIRLAIISIHDILNIVSEQKNQAEKKEKANNENRNN